MRKHPKRSLVAIDPRQVDISPDAPLRFRFQLPGEHGESEPDKYLTESIKQVGVLEPPLLIEYTEPISSHGHAAQTSEEYETYIVVQGFRRIAAAREAAIGEVNVLAVPESALSIREIINLWLEGIPYGTALSELEKIILTDKAARLAGVEWPELLTGMSRAVGRELSQTHLPRLHNLLELEPATLKAFHAGSVSTADLLLLSEHPSIDTSEAVRLLCSEKLNRREQKDAVNLMLRIADHGTENWKRFTAHRDQDSGSLLTSLKNFTYPSLVKDLERIDNIFREMHLPLWAAIHPPTNLEGRNYDINIRIHDEDSLALVIKKLQDALDTGKITMLLDILRGKE